MSDGKELGQWQPLLQRDSVQLRPCFEVRHPPPPSRSPKAQLRVQGRAWTCVWYSAAPPMLPLGSCKGEAHTPLFCIKFQVTQRGTAILYFTNTDTLFGRPSNFVPARHSSLLHKKPVSTSCTHHCYRKLNMASLPKQLVHNQPLLCVVPHCGRWESRYNMLAHLQALHPQVRLFAPWNFAARVFRAAQHRHPLSAHS